MDYDYLGWRGLRYRSLLPLKEELDEDNKDNECLP